MQHVGGMELSPLVRVLFLHENVKYGSIFIECIPVVKRVVFDVKDTAGVSCTLLHVVVNMT